jgi:hypothetical protein
MGILKSQNLKIIGYLMDQEKDWGLGEKIR